VDVIEYFKALAEETGIPYQNLINLYLRECPDRQEAHPLLNLLTHPEISKACPEFKIKNAASLPRPRLSFLRASPRSPLSVEVPPMHVEYCILD
jgi:hypothetical protein